MVSKRGQISFCFPQHFNVGRNTLLDSSSSDRSIVVCGVFDNFDDERRCWGGIINLAARREACELYIFRSLRLRPFVVGKPRAVGIWHLHNAEFVFLAYKIPASPCGHAIEKGVA